MGDVDFAHAIQTLRLDVRARFADRCPVACPYGISSGFADPRAVRGMDLRMIRSSIAAIRILAQKAHVCLRCGGRGPERPCTPACVDWQVARFMAWAGSPERENENG